MKNIKTSSRYIRLFLILAVVVLISTFAGFRYIMKYEHFAPSPSRSPVYSPSGSQMYSPVYSAPSVYSPKYSPVYSAPSVYSPSPAHSLESSPSSQPSSQGGVLVNMPIPNTYKTPSSILPMNGSLVSSEKTNYLINGDYKLLMQNNGNLVLRNNNTIVWEINNKKGTAPFRATLNNTGNLSVHGTEGYMFWDTNTINKGTAPYILVLTNTGILQIADSTNKIIWNSTVPSPSPAAVSQSTSSVKN